MLCIVLCTTTFVFRVEAPQFVEEAFSASGYPQRLPGWPQALHALRKCIPVVFFVEESLLVLEMHVVPVRLLRDLPLPKPALLFRRQHVQRCNTLRVTGLRQLENNSAD